jgi:hypothetical protein
MGNIQCVSGGRSAITWDLIEKSLKNVNTPLEKRINEEYCQLKKQYKENCNSINKHQVDNFIKWYKMAHCDKYGNIIFTKENNSNEGKNMNSSYLDSLPNMYSNGVRGIYNEVEFDNNIFGKNISSIEHLESNSLYLNTLTSSQNLIDNLYELNMRNYAEKNKNRFLERVMKGTPKSFKWIGWEISAELPADRSSDIYKNFLNEKLQDQIDLQIKKDLNRTLVEILSPDKNLDDEIVHSSLYRVLRAYSSIDKELSYCQGMNFIVGFLLLCSDLNETDTFYMLISIFSHTFSKKFGIRGFFIDNFPLLKCYCFIFNNFFSMKMPALKKHFDKLELPDEVWVSKWMQTLYTICLPFECSTRLWDCILSQGIEFLIPFSIAFVKQFEDDLLVLEDSFDVIDFFKKIFNGKNNKYTLNLEDIINITKKLDISKQSVMAMQKQYENLNKIELRFIFKEYNLNIPIKNLVQSNQISDINLYSTIIHTGQISSSQNTNENPIALSKEQNNENGAIEQNEETVNDIIDGYTDMNHENENEDEDIGALYHKLNNHTLVPKKLIDKNNCNR